MLTKSIALLTLILLASCASKPVTIETAKPVKSHKQFRYSKKSKARNALLSFIRNNSIAGSTCDSRITIDGKKVGDVGNGRIINIYLKPGRHKVTITPSNKRFCGEGKKESTITLKKNGEKHFKLALIQNVKLQRMQRAPVEEL